MKKVVVENTIYSLFLYMLINKGCEDSFFILSNTIDKTIIDKINKYSKGVYVYKSKIKGSIFNKVYNFYREQIKLRCHYRNKLKGESLCIFGNDDLSFSHIFRKYGFNVIEDGLINYDIAKKKQYEVKKLLSNYAIFNMKRYSPLGYDKKVKLIFLTGILKIPKVLEKKVRLINPRTLWEELPYLEKESILDIFGVDINFLESISEKSIVVFTQCLSEDGFISEKVKIEIYTKLLLNYPIKDVIIKTHPRELTNYKAIFPEAQVIDTPFPAEILSLIGVNFKKIVTLFSSAATSFDRSIQLDFHGTEFDPRLKDKFGIIQFNPKKDET